MSKLREIMNSQLNLALEEIEALEHGSERTKLRIMLIGALANTASVEFKDAPKGKDAIKEDTAKDVNPVEEESEQIDFEAEYTGTNCSICGEPQFTSPSGITCENGHGGAEPAAEEVVEEIAQEVVEEATEETVTEEEIPMAENLVVLNEEGQEVDITDAYNSVLYAESDEDRQALALQITEYMCLPAYQTLNELVVTNTEGEEELLCDNYYKFMLAYYLTPNEDGSTGLEVVNEYVSQFTDGQCASTYEFINNDNIEAFINWLSN